MPQDFPRCQLVPEPGHQLRFRVDGETRLVWHHGSEHPRPCFYPVIGPAGVPLTRMGHPGAPNHDHHQSIWFAHADLGGVDFWANGPDTGTIRQAHWHCYEDGDEHAAMAVHLHWIAPTGAVLLHQDLVTILRPLPHRESLIEIQTSLTPTQATLPIAKSNFGILAVRVSKALSVHFGGGTLTSSEGAEDEATGFGQYARWWDDSGPVAPGSTGNAARWNGITYFDHPGNPHYPAHWHVREDGWMGASLTRHRGINLKSDAPLRLRYLLHVHDHAYDHAIANQIATAFEDFPWWRIEKSSQKHQAYQLTAESPHSHEQD